MYEKIFKKKLSKNLSKQSYLEKYEKLIYDWKNLLNMQLSKVS